MSEVEDILCAICSKPEKDPTKVIECLYCFKSEHFKCRNLAGEAIRKFRKQPFYCSLDCRNLHAATTTKSSAEESLVLKELRTVLTEIRETKSELSEVRNTVKEIEKSQDFVSTKLDGILSELQELKINQNKLKKDVVVLQSDQRKVEETVSNLELEVDRINRLALSANAVILGVPMKASENLNQIVELIARTVGYALPPNAILDCKRLVTKDADKGKNKTIPIKVVFASEKFKEDLFERKKAHGQLLLSAIGFESTIARKIILRDDLTSYGINLLKTAREKQAEADFKYIWPGRNGVILAKKTDGAKIEVVRCQNDLSKLDRPSNKRQLDISSGSSGSPSTPHGFPAAKR
ncbi:uncharacterized protein LOC129743318 [Uranotaenia lowii]|uniref:uncharacterized protein LOC129743318 n=1 Tax=Uranotaenia lowii TaxID=190385 RepID=UPI00247A780B|nr:uncharacterized protein LOC129743318 [Uranotaenia lowii]